MSPEERADLLQPLTTTRAAEYLTERGLPMSAKTVKRLVQRGELASKRTPGGQERIKRSVLDRYIASLQ